MNKRFLILIFGAFFLQEQVADIKLPQNFSTIVEKLIFFKKNNFKVFYGGPIGGSDKGVKWVMPVAFEDELHKTTRAVYEIAFVNCNFDTADGAEIMFVDICDIDIKFKNMFSPDYASFASLLRGEYIHEKYIVVRRADVAHIYYPDIFISADHSPHVEDKSQIIHFLHENFKTKNCSKDCNTSLREKQVIAYENDFEISYVPLKVQTNFHGEAHQFS